MNEQDYNKHPRTLRSHIVKSISIHADGGSAGVSTEDGIGFGVDAGHPIAQLQPGQAFEIETLGFSRITGFKIDGEWVERKTDAELELAHAEFVAEFERRKAERLAEKRDELVAREGRLPGWLRERIATFHERGGEHFKLEGWEYEIVVAELAALFDAHWGDEESDADPAEVSAYAAAEGVSGNQYGLARLLARAHRAGESLAESPSALTPITGDPFYEGVKK